MCSHFHPPTSSGLVQIRSVGKIKSGRGWDYSGNLSCMSLCIFTMRHNRITQVMHSQALYDRLVALTNVMLRDSMWSLAISTSKHFVQTVTGGEVLGSTRQSQPPRVLFSTSLVVKEGSIQFSPPFSLISERILSGLDDGLRYEDAFLFLRFMKPLESVQISFISIG